MFLYILNRIFPLYGLAWAQTVTEIILATVAVVVLVRMFRGFKREDAVDKEISG